ncbi:hypothetical protein F4778DRAFT_392488 [Xylariomycetidae sp. FL2044]|nr:hypothetical protein F4778DRAFT_392488 [Xylariomycetidae sp. FL2044]
MDCRPIPTDSKYTYPSQLWTRSISSPAVPRLNTPSPSAPDPYQAQYPIRIDWVPILLPQQSSLYQTQLLQYNKLIAPGRGGGGLQIRPLPPILSAQHVHSGPRSRAASKVSNKDSRPRQGSQNCHGNRGNTTTSNKADRAVMTGKDLSTKMPPKKSDMAHGLAPRPKPSTSPSVIPPHPNSVPSTPHQHARKFSFESREQSPSAHQSHSPRSAYSETNGALPSLRPLPPRHGGCKYENGLKFYRRRMPYSLGADPLERIDLKNVQSKLSEDDERKLSTDMRDLYDRLQPTEAVESRRHKLVQKLEKLLNEAWPGHDIRVHLFGSSGNLLCSDDSDVDICITTEWKELEAVCMLADLLAKHGMEKVVCVSSAKVPIVKVWDPELQLSCDMNVNNTLALENTRMIKTYVEIDERVRPLAMIIKHWTRRRVVNDAAYGGTLSSYTWICLIIAFLQLRQPPVLPALHQRPHQKLPKKNGELPAFADDIDKLRGFGLKNKSTLGELLFQFFRFYAHEFDYDENVLSIRLGKLMPKKEKKTWLLALNSRLGVEEPFNTSRNLGNTADDTSFRGLHMELRRAFDLIAQGKLDECCEQFEYPKEEEKIFQKPPPVPRPALLRSSSQQQSARGGRGGNFRGGNRQQGQHRNGANNNNRRASSTNPFDHNTPQMYLPAGYPVALAPQDASGAMYMQPSPEAVAQTLSALQLQENNLRFLQFTQSQAFAQHQAMQHAQRMQGGAPQSQTSTERSRTNSFDTPPLSAPLRPDMRPEMYYYPMQLQQAQALYAQQGYPSYPASPSGGHNTELRRNSHRTTAAGDVAHPLSGSSLRSQSQPASRPVAGLPTVQGFANPGPMPNGYIGVPARHVKGVPMPSFIPDEATDAEQDGSTSNSPPDEEKSYGYYMDPASPPRRTSGTSSGMPAFGDIGPQAPGQTRGRLSSEQIPQSVLDKIKQTSPSPPSHSRAYSVGRNSAPVASAPFPVGNGLSRDIAAPLVVNGSMSHASTGSSPRQPFGNAKVTAEYGAFDNPLHINQSPLATSTEAGPSVPDANTPLNSTSPASDRPLVVNGSTSTSTPHQQAGGPHYTNEAVALLSNGGLNVTNSSPAAGFMPTHGSPIAHGQVPAHFQRHIRATPNLIAQLDLATENRIQANQNLSPVYEASSPSPSLTRKPEFPINYYQWRPIPGTSRGEGKPDVGKGKQKSPSEMLGPKLEGPVASNPRVNGIARESGHVRGAKSESDNTNNANGSTAWQKMTRGRKRGTDAKSRGEVNPHSEQLPKNDSERKGG